jgi:hypothetical protein
VILGFGLEAIITRVMWKLGRTIKCSDCLAAATRSSPSEQRSYRIKLQPLSKYLKHFPGIESDGTCKYFGLDQKNYVLNTGYPKKKLVQQGKHFGIAAACSKQQIY